MNHKKLLSSFGVKWNPFTPDLPVEAILSNPRLDHFFWRVEEMVMHGGFALITGDPGTGKSAALRKLAHRLSEMRDVSVGVLSRPQSGAGDFYRELGDVFGVKISASNRWGGFKVLREKWRAHLEASLLRPVLLIDEAQEMLPAVLSELRLLASADFDSTSLLTVVLAGDERLAEKFRHEDLLPLGSRIRARIRLGHATRDELVELLKTAIAKAGSAQLMTTELMETLADHAMGNYRALMNMAAELLEAALAQDVGQLDEKLYFEVFGGQPPKSSANKKKTSTRRAGMTP